MTAPPEVPRASPSADPVPVLEARSLGKVYERRGERRRRGGAPGHVVALADVDLAVHQGESLGIVGESGSGKSTLVRLLLVLEQPSEGAVLFNGVQITGRPEREIRALRRNVQVVFQDPMGSLDPRMKVRTTISEPLRALQMAGDHRARVDELLEAVGLTAGSGDGYPHEFSGGQRQRIAIARALAPHPSVLIADEAVSALDVSVRAQVLNLLSELKQQFGLTLVFVSHDMSVIRHLCDSVAVIYRGRVVEVASSSEIYANPCHPYTQGLLASVPRIGQRLADKPSGEAAEKRVSHGCAYAPRCPIAIDRCWVERPELSTLPGTSREVACHLGVSQLASRR